MIKKTQYCEGNTEFIKGIRSLTASAPESVLFFDIETTGLSAATSYLYLIGCLYIRDNRLTLTQFLAQSVADEVLLLKEFEALSKEFSSVVHFNGQTFDIPYITKRAGHHGLSDPFTGKESFDLYYRLRKYKNLFGLDSTRQKAFEAAAGYKREDTADGGDLIVVFSKYAALISMEQRGLSDEGLLSQAAELEAMLLLHNHDDVYGMVKLLSLCTEISVFEGKAEPVEASPVYDNNSGDIRFIEIVLSNSLKQLCSLPVFGKKESPATLKYDSLRCRAVLSIEIEKTELKLFYPNYREYVYLPYEDKVIPASLGQFMDKSVKASATKKNCYTRHALSFMRLFGKAVDCPLHIFRKEYGAKELYIEVNEFLKSDEDFKTVYLTEALRYLAKM